MNASKLNLDHKQVTNKNKLDFSDWGILFAMLLIVTGLSFAIYNSPKALDKLLFIFTDGLFIIPILLRFTIGSRFDKLFEDNILNDSRPDNLLLIAFLLSTSKAKKRKLYRSVLYARCIAFPLYSNKLPLKLWFNGYDFRKNASLFDKTILVVLGLNLIAFIAVGTYSSLLNLVN